MFRLIFILSTLVLFGCTTTTPVETTKRVAEGVVKAPIKTVVYIGENGQRTIVNYYGTLKELNEDNKSNEVILFKREF